MSNLSEVVLDLVSNEIQHDLVRTKRFCFFRQLRLKKLEQKILESRNKLIGLV